jgi:TonB family protein
MSQTILLVDYEPRTVARVKEALASLGFELVTAKDVDAAVTTCAKVEPRAVLITSVLPKLKVDDAITQLRARAGLRNTPFLVLMSGYTGIDSRVDATRLGAQDIIGKPFSNDDLLARVKTLIQKPKSESVGPDTRADVLEALRRSAGLVKDSGTVTSRDLFGDLIADEHETPNAAQTQRVGKDAVAASVTAAIRTPILPEVLAPAKPAAPKPTPTPVEPKQPASPSAPILTSAPSKAAPERPAPSTTAPIPISPAPQPAKPVAPPVEAARPPAPAPTPTAAPGPARAKVVTPPVPAPMTRVLPPPEPDTAVNRVLESTLAEVRDHAPKPKIVEDTGGRTVDELLSKTLSGLEVRIPTRATAKPEPPRPEPPKLEPPKVELPTPTRPKPEPVMPAPVKAAPAPTPSLGATPTPIAAPVAPAVRPAPPAPTRPVREEAAAETGGGGTPFGQYELMEIIATGGMAEVFKARMRGVEGFQKIVAIKRILPHLTANDEFVTMFIDEAKLAAQLQHPNIIHIYDLGKLERSYYIAMEYIDGKDLRSILRQLDEKERRLPLGLALFIASRLAAALDYAHRKRDLQNHDMSLVHRDVSPQNVLISFDGDIKLCDFGIAKAASKASHTRAGALKGKLQYMSPEQAWGKDLDHRSDIFSLGLVLYEMLTGRKAFAGDSELSILEQVRSPQIVAPRDIDPSIPPEIERIVLRTLKENREERYQTAADMASELANILQSLRPTPGASELGMFLGDLAGKERPLATTAALPLRPAPAPIQPPAPVVQTPKPTPRPAPPPRVIEPPREEVSAIGAPAKKAPIGLIAGIAATVIVVVAAVIYLTRGTSGPPTEELVRQAAQAEVEQRSRELRDRLVAEMRTPTPGVAEPDQSASGAVVQPTARPVLPTQAAATRPTAAPGLVPTVLPTAQPAIATPVPTDVPELPTPTPFVPTPEPVQPTAPPPTRPPLVSEPQVAVREGDLVAIDSDVVPPVAIHKPNPPVPAMARQKRGKGGVVIVEALVDETGAARETKVLRGIRPDFGYDRTATDAVRGWRFKPATKSGVRVKVRYVVTVTFPASL